MPAQTAGQASCLPTVEYPKPYANQVDTDKTKTMAFFETPYLHRAQKGQNELGPNMPPFHVYSPYPVPAPSSNPILDVDQFDYLGLILDPKLPISLQLKPSDALRKAMLLPWQSPIPSDVNKNPLSPPITNPRALEIKSTTPLSSELKAHSEPR